MKKLRVAFNTIVTSIAVRKLFKISYLSQNRVSVIPAKINALAICGRLVGMCKYFPVPYPPPPSRKEDKEIFEQQCRNPNDIALLSPLDSRQTPLFPPPPPPEPEPATVLAKVTRLAFTEGCFCGSLWPPSVVAVVVGGGCEASFGIAVLADAVLRIRRRPLSPLADKK